MAITVSCINTKHTIIRWDYQGIWNWDNFMNAVASTGDLLSRVDRSVYCIINHPDGETLPPSIAAYMRNLLDATPLFSHPAVRKVIFVGNMALTDVIDVLVERVYPTLSGVVDTARSIEEAYRMIEHPRLAAVMYSNN